MKTTPASTFLHQHKYTQELIALAGLQEGNSVQTPMKVNVKHHKDERELYLILLSIDNWSAT